MCESSQALLTPSTVPGQKGHGRHEMMFLEQNQSRGLGQLS